MSRSSQMLASVYNVPPADRAAKPLAELMTIASQNAAARDGAASGALANDLQKGRPRIWDLHTSLHCSIIGTCLTQGELRSLLRRLRVDGAETAGDHDLHMLGVLLAARPKEGAKLLQKLLDKRHRLVINRFAKARDAAELGALWDAAMSGGDIPGAYWAILTHPLSTDQLTRRAFGDVHMLSHLVGATNRADIRRLRELEQQNASLLERMESQQKRLRNDITERDREIRRLSDLLAQKLADERQLIARANDASNFLEVIRELENRLDEEIGRRQSAEQNLRLVSAAYEQTARACSDAENERNALRLEIMDIEGQLEAVLAPDDELSAPLLDLAGTTVLYVGGRAKQVRQLRALVERVNGQFLHHDGGMEDGVALLPGLLGRADVAVFPVDCISHNAATAVKRFCDQVGRPYVPLRTSSLSCLLSALTALGRRLSSPATTLQ
jgi:hypothetical protein